MFHLLVLLFVLMFHWPLSVGGESALALERVQWKHRILAYVVSSDSERVEVEQSLQRWSAELVDRDMLLVNLGDIELETPHSLAIGPDEKALWRQHWNIDLTESRFVLIGKDGGAKAFQKEQLDVTQFFELIDTMPMRAAELRARRNMPQSQ